MTPFIISSIRRKMPTQNVRNCVHDYNATPIPTIQIMQVICLLQYQPAYLENYQQKQTLFQVILPSSSTHL